MDSVENMENEENADLSLINYNELSLKVKHISSQSSQQFSEIIKYVNKKFKNQFIMLKELQEHFYNLEGLPNQISNLQDKILFLEVLPNQVLKLQNAVDQLSSLNKFFTLLQNTVNSIEKRQEKKYEETTQELHISKKKNEDLQSKLNFLVLFIILNFISNFIFFVFYYFK
jgi:hypothetical protein